jgi:hypothetical protein
MVRNGVELKLARIAKSSENRSYCCDKKADCDSRS